MVTKKNILLTGATGTVGKEVLKQLLEKKAYNIIVFSTQKSKNKNFYSKIKEKITVHYGSLEKEEDLQKITESIDVVIHLAAIIPPLADEKPEMARRVNSLGTKYLLSRLKELNKNAFFMYSSSVSVYGDRLSNPNIKVDDPLIASEGDEYGLTKIEAEKHIQNSGLNWSIFRLSAIMGVKNHKLSKLMFHMPLDTPMEIVTPSDTARVFVNAIEKKSILIGKFFNLGGGEKCRLTYRELLEKSFDLYGLGKLNFPPKTFAEKNFHCGYMVDSDKLEELLSFRTHTLDDYFLMTKNSIPWIQKTATMIFSYPVKKYLQSLSEPLHAFKTKDQKLINRFFKN